MFQYKFSFFFLFLVVFLSSCRKDNIKIVSERIPPITQLNVETSLSGTVTDRSGLPIADASISIINETTSTNQFGYFEITGLVGEIQGVIKVEKEGYFNQFKALVPNENAVDRTRIQLIEKTNPKMVSATSGGSVIVKGGTKVDFAANSFTDQSGNTYSGEVSVYSFYIDPTDTDIDMIMPGNLMARNRDNELRLLQSFGMANVELEGSSGQKLNINKPATLTMEVPAGIVGEAPASIPLWYFEEDTGLWMEEGTAQLTEGLYEGIVNHFTFWNCDVDIEFFTYLNGQIINDAGNPLVKVRITDIDTGSSAFDWTDSEGNYEGYVPMNSELLLEVLDVCGTSVIYSENIGPFTDPTTQLETINISEAPQLIEISGVLNDCDGEPVSNGQLVLHLPGSYYPQSASVAIDGSFNLTTTVCSATEIEITAIDYSNSVIGDPMTYTVSPNMDLGTINVCGDQDTEGSVVFVVDGMIKVIPGCTVEITQVGGQTNYAFVYADLEAGSVGAWANYETTLFDTNNDLTNPSWIDPNPGSSWQAPSWDLDHSTGQDSLRLFPAFLTNVGTYTVLQTAENPGDVLTLQFENTKVNTIDIFADGTSNGMLTENSTVTFNAILQ